MRTIKASVLVAVLATALVLGTVTNAEAKRTGIDEKLSPKSYGSKTSYKVTSEKVQQDIPEHKKFLMKSEQLKTKLKQIEAQKALEFFKKTYGL
jgi:hypothetical protein